MKTAASILTVLVFVAASSSVYSAEKRAAPKGKNAPVAVATETPPSESEAPAEPATDSGDGFRCEKMRNAKLADLKEKLVTNCNLKLPYSIAGGDFALDSSYTYCCHKR